MRPALNAARDCLEMSLRHLENALMWASGTHPSPHEHSIWGFSCFINRIQEAADIAALVRKPKETSASTPSEPLADIPTK